MRASGLPCEPSCSSREKTSAIHSPAFAKRVSPRKEEVEQLHSADIFSVKIYKETGAIERLAKQLKTLAKG